MKRTVSEKAADVLVDTVGRVEWNPYLFVGILMGQSIEIQRRLVELCIEYLSTYARNAAHPDLRYRTDAYAASLIDSVDLTDFDQQ